MEKLTGNLSGQANELIRMENVEKNYAVGESIVRALAGVNLKVQSGDFIAVVGKSGSGKSTLMNMIGALDIPSRGKIYLDSNNIASMRESALAQLRGKRIGFVFQNFNLIPTLTAKENVALPMLFQGIEKSKRLRIAEAILKKVGLSDRMQHLPSQLSGGQSQRVVIARALANNPEIILADEPTGNLDSKTGEEILKILIALNREGKTIIVVTHDVNIAKYAKKILKMKDGRFENVSKNKI